MISILRDKSRIFAAMIAIVAIAMTLAACSSATPTGSNTSQSGEGTGTLEGDGATLVLFMPTSNHPYTKAFAESAQGQAEELGYQLKVIENNWDQTEQDQQVQEWLATGEKPAAILFWPSSAAASVNSIRLLSQVAPVLQVNQPVATEAADYVVGYAGVNDYNIGVAAGESALQAIAERSVAGATFHGPDGKPNLLHIRFSEGYTAGDDRQAGFEDATGDAFNVLHIEPLNTIDAQSAFEIVSQLVPKYKEEGLDFLFCQSNSQCDVIMPVLEQNGLIPGEDVTVIVGDLSGDTSHLQEGRVYSGVVQSPVVEGELVVRYIAQYLATGATIPGEITAEDSVEAPELKLESPTQSTYLMSPTVNAETYPGYVIWGLSIDELF